MTRPSKRRKLPTEMPASIPGIVESVQVERALVSHEVVSTPTNVSRGQRGQGQESAPEHTYDGLSRRRPLYSTPIPWYWFSFGGLGRCLKPRMTGGTGTTQGLGSTIMMFSRHARWLAGKYGGSRTRVLAACEKKKKTSYAPRPGLAKPQVHRTTPCPVRSFD